MWLKMSTFDHVKGFPRPSHFWTIPANLWNCLFKNNITDATFATSQISALLDLLQSTGSAIIVKWRQLEATTAQSWSSTPRKLAYLVSWSFWVSKPLSEQSYKTYRQVWDLSTTSWRLVVAVGLGFGERTTNGISMRSRHLNPLFKRSLFSFSKTHIQNLYQRRNTDSSMFWL